MEKGKDGERGCDGGRKKTTFNYPIEWRMKILHIIKKKSPLPKIKHSSSFPMRNY